MRQHELDDVPGAGGRVMLRRVDMQVGYCRRLEWIVNAAQAVQLVGVLVGQVGSAVQALGVAPAQLVERAVDIDHLDVAVALHEFLAHRLVGADGADDGDDAMGGELVSDKAEAAQVVAAVFAREAEVGKQRGAVRVAVDDFYRYGVLREQVAGALGQG